MLATTACRLPLRVFDAFAERTNWMGIPVAQDNFATRMPASRVPMAVLKAWSVDPQVKIEEGKIGSIFDALEDMVADACLAKCADSAKLNKPPTGMLPSSSSSPTQ